MAGGADGPSLQQPGAAPQVAACAGRHTGTGRQYRNSKYQSDKKEQKALAREQKKAAAKASKEEKNASGFKEGNENTLLARKISA